MHYIAATDGSPESDEAVGYAARQAVATDAVLELVHVLTPEAELKDGRIVMPGEDVAIEEGHRTLERAEQLAIEATASTDGDDTDTHLTVKTQLLAGRPANAIAEHATEIGADAIYVGHRGLTEEQEQAVGSVAKSVIDKATVPVTITR